MLTPAERACLARIIERGAPPGERACGDHFEPAPDQVPTSRVDEWIDTVAAGDRARFERLLVVRGIAWSDFERSLADVRLRDPERLPRWAAALFELLDPPSPNPEPGTLVLPGDATTRSDDVFGIFLSVARDQLTDVAVRTEISISSAAQFQAVGMLRQRLFNAANQALGRELRAIAYAARMIGDTSGDTNLAATRDAWFKRLETYPVLGYLFGTIFLSWRNGLAEMLERLAADRALLADRLFGVTPPGPIVELRGDLGDPHDGGRSVAILGFEGGQRVVYKPKDLRVGAAFIGLIDYLNSAGLEPRLHSRTIIPRGRYAWEECVGYAPCASTSEIGRFYVRMGMTIRLLQFLEARDFWLDNLIAHGEHPVFVDLEMLLQPRAQPLPTLAPAERMVLDQLEESALPTAAVTMHAPIDLGVAAEELGALSTPRAYLTPFKATPGGGGTSGTARNGYLTWSHPEHAPSLDGTPADAADYFNQLLDGYRLMQTCLEANQSSLVAEDGPLAPFAALPVRAIYRDTWSCYKLIHLSLAPSALVDGERRERLLARMFIAAFDEPTLTDNLVRIIDAEHDSLRVLDVPFFLAWTDRSGLERPDGRPVADVFERTAWARLRDRVRNLANFPIERHVDLFRSGFSTGHQVPTPSLAGASAGARDTAWLKSAVEIGNQILAAATKSPGGDMAWLGLVYEPLLDAQQMDVLPADLLSGTAGLAIFFADLYGATGQEHFANAARRILRAFSPESVSRARIRGPKARAFLPELRGGFVGLGSQLYALRRCARALGDSDLAARATMILTSLDPAELTDETPTDLVGGASGMLLALLACTDADSLAPTLKRATIVAAQIIRSRRDDGTLPPPPYPATATYLAGLPTPDEAYAIGLARLRRTGGVQPAPAGDASNDGPPVANQLEECWKHADGGPSGSVLAQLALAKVDTPSGGNATAQAKCFLAVSADLSASAGLLDGIEVALAAFRLAGERCFFDAAKRRASQLLANRRAAGRWFPESFAADGHNLSIYRGIAAVGHALLQMYNPAAVKSVRLLE